MKTRQIIEKVTGQRAIDGAGVHLVRVIGHSDVKNFDPFLMMDAFDAEDKSAYEKGFPFHPHRGIETITYLIEGTMEHRDSMGNVGLITSGGAQWMTAGSGVMHEEMPKESKRMLGVQLWLNLPQKDKMTEPMYHDINAVDIQSVSNEAATVKVIAGTYQDISAKINGDYIKPTILDVELNGGAQISIPTKAEENVYIFFIDGDGYVNGEFIPNKTAVLFGEGDQIQVEAPTNTTRFLFFSGRPLRESVAWAGPVVMNTEEELTETFKELREGSFIKHKAKM